LLVVVKRLEPLTALSGTVYRLASSMSDHTPVLINVFEDWNEESVVQHIPFYSIRMQMADSQVPSFVVRFSQLDLPSSDGVCVRQMCSCRIVLCWAELTVYLLIVCYRAICCYYSHWPLGRTNYVPGL